MVALEDGDGPPVAGWWRRARRADCSAMASGRRDCLGMGSRWDLLYPVGRFVGGGRARFQMSCQWQVCRVGTLPFFHGCMLVNVPGTRRQAALCCFCAVFCRFVVSREMI